jgi:hypothetical protein
VFLRGTRTVKSVGSITSVSPRLILRIACKLTPGGSDAVASILMDDLLEVFGFGRALALAVAMMVSIAALATATGPRDDQGRAAEARRGAAATAARLR